MLIRKTAIFNDRNVVHALGPAEVSLDDFVWRQFYKPITARAIESHQADRFVDHLWIFLGFAYSF